MADEIPVACCLSDEGLIVHTAPIEDEHKPIVLDCSHYAGMFSRGQQSSIFSISSLGNEDWAKLTRSQSINWFNAFKVFRLTRSDAFVVYLQR
jgi:hypothetical protein